MAESCEPPPTFEEGLFDENLEEQRDEVLALQSIYEDRDIERLKILSSPSDKKEGLYTIHVTVPVRTDGQSIKVDILMPAQLSDAAGASGDTTLPNVGKEVNFLRSDSGQKWVGSFSVKYLAPLTLQLVLPPTYPSQSAPVFTLSSVYLSTNQISSLCKQLDTLWEEMQNLPVIFTWVDWLENNILSHLSITDSLVIMPAMLEDECSQDSRALSDCLDIGQTVITMLRHNEVHLDIEFFRSNHECQVCYEELPGNYFHKIKECGHHFCNDCMTTYCEHHVSIGTVENLRCPDTDCKAVIPPHIVQSVLPEEDFARWEKLMLQKTLESMSDIDWCPRCNNPVIQEAEADLNLGHCTFCVFSFCTECRDPWHQGEPCMTLELKMEESEKRSNKPRNEAERRRFEELRKNMKEAFATSSFLKKKNRNCPSCRIPIEKIAGCNKMTCRCGTSFCWVCGKKIGGYNHFSEGGCGLVTIQTATVVTPAMRERSEEALWIDAQLDVDPKATQRLIRCPLCKQRNMKEGKNNHIKCWGCKANFCFMCKKRIVGPVTQHFVTETCTQHS